MSDVTMKWLAPLSLVALSLSFSMGCGSSSSEDSGTDEGASSDCINFGFLGTCRDTGAKTMPKGWPIPAMALVYSEKFQLPMSMLEHPKMTPLPLNPQAVGAEIKTSSSNSQGMTCDKSGQAPGSCSFSLLVEAKLITDPTGAVIPSAYSYKPANFEVNGRVAELFLEVSDNGKLGPLVCQATTKGAKCKTAAPTGAIVNVYTPNSDTSEALAEASLEPPTTSR